MHLKNTTGVDLVVVDGDTYVDAPDGAVIEISDTAAAPLLEQGWKAAVEPKSKKHAEPADTGTPTPAASPAAPQEV